MWACLFVLRDVRNLSAQDVLRDKEGVRRTLGEAAHQVGIPLRPEWNVNAHTPPLFCKLGLEIATNSVQHLEFESRRRNSFSAAPMFDLVDDALIVSGEAMEDAAPDEVLRDLDVIGID